MKVIFPKEKEEEEEAHPALAKQTSTEEIPPIRIDEPSMIPIVLPKYQIHV
jgi:hypothetical protein